MEIVSSLMQQSFYVSVPYDWSFFVTFTGRGGTRGREKQKKNSTTIKRPPCDP